MTFVLAIIAGLVGLAVGWAAFAFAALLYASAAGMSNFEGAAAMSAVFGIGPIGGLIGLVIGIWLVLRRGGAGRGPGRTALRGLLVVGAVGAVIAAGFGAVYLTRDAVNPDAPPPQLAFELRLPPGDPPPPTAIKVELHTDKNQMPGILFERLTRREGGRTIVGGQVELYFRTSRRLLVVKRNGEPDRLFRLKLSANPGHTKEMGTWQKVDHVADAGPTGTKPPGPGDDYNLRYRVVWVGQE